MNIVVIGKSGQLAWELARLNSVEHSIICLGRNDVDISNKQLLTAKLTSLSADALINASAYTSVDLAESDELNAFNINGLAVKNIAEVCKILAIPLVHVSTDFVFSGDKGSPYLVDDAIAPLGVYGASKAQGEQFITEVYPQCSCIIRTSWVYSSHGNNFVKTMLKLMSERDELGIISDQIGTPTYAKNLAMLCVNAAINKVSGIHHWTDAGIASWYDFAVAIQELGIANGLLSKVITIKPIRTEDYPTPAKRPSYSVLDKTTLASAFLELPLIHWRDQLDSMLNELKTMK